MSRRVPEFALVTGVFLGVSTTLAGVLFGWGFLTTSVLTALASYPFVAYAVVADDDPTTVLPPRPVLAAGALFGLALFAASLWADPSPANAFAALFVGLLVALPPAAYAVRVDAGVNPLSPEATALAGVASGALLVPLGIASNAALYGAADGLLVALSAAVYGSARGVRFSTRTKRAAVAAGIVLSLAVVGVGVVRGEPLGEWLLAAMALTLAPSLYSSVCES
jgi:hypothetical protein